MVRAIHFNSKTQTRTGEVHDVARDDVLSAVPEWTDSGSLTADAGIIMVMVMVTKPVRRIPQSLPAGEFKAKCLKLMDQVAESGTAIVITKRGRPVARLVPIESPPAKLAGFFAGKIEIDGDIISPVGDTWDAFR